MLGWRKPWFFLLRQRSAAGVPRGQILRYFLEALTLSIGYYVHGAVKPFFHRDFLRLSCSLDLIKRAIMGNGEVILDRTLFFDTENTIESSAVSTYGPVQIGFRIPISYASALSIMSHK